MGSGSVSLDVIDAELLLVGCTAGLWTSIKYSAGIGIVALVFYAGYTIVVTLLPGGSSANAVMRRASEVLKADPEVLIFSSVRVDSFHGRNACVATAESILTLRRVR